MNKVVITGYGIKSCIGNTPEEVYSSLLNGNSGVVFKKEYKDLNFKSHVAGQIDIDLKELIDRKLLRFMGEASGYAYLASVDALSMASLSLDDINLNKVGVIAGSGGASSRSQLIASDIVRDSGTKRVGPYAVTKTMGSTISATLGTALKLKGVNYSISSACSTSAHCIGHAFELIKSGSQNIIIAGGGEDEHWTTSSMFDAMGALSSKFNEIPHKASRAFDKNRDGFVISGGAGIVVLEEKNHAIKRGARIIAELNGYCANSDGYDMVSPSGEGAIRCMKDAIKQSDKKIDYINAHGTSTPVGDLAEINAIKKVFDGANQPYISSTKSITGHSLGAAGAQELIYCLIMMENNFIAPSINIEDLEDEAKELNIVKKSLNYDLNTVMSNSFGFGGTNASIVISKHQ